MPFLPSAACTLTYNNYTFNSSTATTVSASPVEDEAGRTYVAIKYTIKASAVIQSDGRTDAEMLLLRQSLQTPGQGLAYEANGFGGFTINVGGVRDCCWGPKPKLEEFRPLGAGNAWKITWSCEVAVPECSTAQYQNAVMAFNYSMSFQIASTGLTTRTYSGYLEIPMTRVMGGRDVPDIADAYRERVAPPIVPGYTREQDYDVSKDKRRLDFRITDSQTAGPLPFDCVAADGTFKIRMTAPNLFMAFVSVNANYTLAPGAARGTAWDHFRLLIADRQGQVPAGKVILPCTEFESEEGLYTSSNRVAFSAAWTMTTTVEKCLKDAGSWRVLPNTDADQWARKPAIKKAMGPRGDAGLTALASDDYIVDLCLPRVTPPEPPAKKLKPFEPAPAPSLTLTTVDPATSWLHYECKVVATETTNVVRMKALPTRPPAKTAGAGTGAAKTLKSGWAPANGQGVPLVDPVSPGYRPASGTDEVLTPVSWAPLDPNTLPAGGQVSNLPAGGRLSILQKPPPADETLQQRATPTYRYTMTGNALRAQYQVPLPDLLQVRSSDGTSFVEATLVRRTVAANECVGMFLGIPVWASSWHAEYVTTQPPKGELPGMVNPALQIS